MSRNWRLLILMATLWAILANLGGTAQGQWQYESPWRPGSESPCGPDGCYPMQPEYAQPYQQPAPSQQAPPAHAASIVRIYNATGNGRTGGSGTLVDVEGESAVVLSCAHLFREGRGEVTVHFQNGSIYAAKVLAVDKAADLSAVEIKNPGLPAVDVATEYPQRGDMVSSCGYGQDNRLWCNRGRVIGYVTVMGYNPRESIEISGFARQGDSGGPMFNAQGQLCGVLFGTDTTRQVVDGTFCGRVRAFLARIRGRFGRPSPQPAEPTPGVTPGAPNVEIPPVEGPPPGVAGPAKPITPKPPSGPIDDIAQAVGTTILSKILVSAGLASGPAGLLAAGMTWLGLRRLKKRMAGDNKTILDRIGTLHLAISQRVGAVIPEPTVVHQADLKLAKVPTTDHEHGRLLEAMRRMAQYDPRTAPTIAGIKSLYDQLTMGAPLVEKLREAPAEGSILGWTDKPAANTAA